MIKEIYNSTCQIILAILNRISNKKRVNKVENKPEIAITIENDTKKDKLLFQPNTIQSNDPLEYPLRSKNQQASNNTAKVVNFNITLECNELAINHLDNLCRFFEVSQTDALARGVWLLTIARDVELNNKKLGIITTDSNGLIVDVMPIDIV
jgi:hypothetical protein